MSSERKAAVAKYHRRTLMTAADRLLSQFGYDGMNMNMLAKEAGYSKATVYVYFRSKDEIVRALAVERLSLMRSEIALALKSDMDDDEKFREIANVIKEFAAEDGAYFDFVCESKFDENEADDDKRALSELVNGIADDVSALAPIEIVRQKWYALYGEIRTKKMFDRSDD